MTDSVISLKCPSCGSPMEAPDTQGMALCNYCGTRIIMPATDVAKENKNFVRYQELCKVAKQAKNWTDLLKYADEILQIDPKNVDGWIDKALATGWLTTVNKDLFGEAMSYLQQASALSPNDEHITEARYALQEAQFNWYAYMGLDRNNRANEIMRLGIAGYHHASNWLIEAMDYYIKALKIKPDNQTALISVKVIRDKGRLVGMGITWDKEVEQILARQDAIKRLPQWQAELKKLQNELSKLQKKKGGFFANLDMKDVQKEIKRISDEVKRLQEAANYELPT